MSRLPYEELDFRKTALGELLLRRRRVPGLGDVDIYEVKLNDDLLVSSLLNDSERALADLVVPEVPGGDLDVLVGGLGLGHTAAAALAHDRVRSVTVVEFLPEVIDWHERGLVPLGPGLVADPRCRFLHGDFFALLAGRDEEEALSGSTFGAVLVDIDHAPDSRLHPDHAGFYGESGLAGAAARLAPGGIFGFWSSGREDPEFSTLLAHVFPEVSAREIEVLNPLVSETQVDTIYVARIAAR